MHGRPCSPPFVRFIYVRMWGYGVLPALCLPGSPSLRVRPSWFICANVWPQGLLVLGLPAPVVPHGASLGPATAKRVLSTPVPVSAPPIGLDECLFFISLVSDPLAVGFSVSSGCARRRSMSTYAAILVLSNSTSRTGQRERQHPGRPTAPEGWAAGGLTCGVTWPRARGQPGR